jgi:glycosyltransferase involved in cell wall biosynthesis
MTSRSGEVVHKVSGVMQVVLSLNPGGTERLVVEIARRVALMSRSVVCCLDDPGAWASELDAAGVEIVALRRRSGFHPSLGLRIARLARDRELNVLHCHQYSSFVYGGIATLRRPSLRLVYTEHGRLSDAPPSRKRRLVNPVLSLLPGPVVAVSNDLREHLVESGFWRRRVGVFYNGIEPGLATDDATRQLVRRSLGLADSSFVIGTVARLDPVKDLRMLIEAFHGLLNEHRDIRLLVVGDGPEREALEQAARALGCVDAVAFMGHRDDARRVLSALDVYVNCSVTEGMSVTILEAMAAGLPVVATRVGGNPELVEDGLSGVLVPSRSASSLRAALESLMGAPAHRSAMGAAGRARLVTEFSMDRMVQRYLAAYGLAGSV